MRGQITRTRSRCYTFTFTCMGTPDLSTHIEQHWRSNEQSSKVQIRGQGAIHMPAWAHQSLPSTVNRTTVSNRRSKSNYRNDQKSKDLVVTVLFIMCVWDSIFIWSWWLDFWLVAIIFCRSRARTRSWSRGRSAGTPCTCTGTSLSSAPVRRACTPSGCCTPASREGSELRTCSRPGSSPSDSPGLGSASIGSPGRCCQHGKEDIEVRWKDGGIERNYMGMVARETMGIGQHS